MATITLNAEARNATGGRNLNRLRKTGYLPAVLYGKTIKAAPIVIKLSEFREILVKEGKNAFLSLKMKEGEHAAIIKHIQYNAINGDILHIDFQQVSLTEKIQSEVAVKLRGRDIAERGGLMAVQHLTEITVECLPQLTPHAYEVEISHMKLGDVVTVADLEKIKDVTIINEADEVIVALVEVKQHAAAEQAEEASAEGAESAAEGKTE